MKRILCAAGILMILFVSGSLYGGSSYYYDTCPGCGGSEKHTYTIPTPSPSFEGSQRNCHTEEYVCGQTCFDGSYDGDRGRQGMGYCIDKICTRTVCE
ncbi:MAG: hypothetical protein ACPL1G_10200 [Thermodesulfovibrionales bacterium]